MKVLILAYDFPPNKSIGGARPESWFLQMPDFGCKPTVITRVWESPLNNPSDTVRKTTIQEKRISRSEERTLIEVPFQPRLRDRLLSKYGDRKYVAIRKALSFIHKVTDFYFLPNVYQSIYDAALEELEDNDYDIIIATGEPFLLFKIASKLSCKTKLPWIADYRDCWTGSRVYENFSNLDTLLSKLLAERHEKHIVSTATCITTPSPSYKRDIKKIFPDKSVNVVYNGFFEEKVNLKNLTLKQSEEVFQIAYIGILYPHQRLELFLDSLSALAFDRPTARFELIFYGLLFYPDQVDRVKRKKQPQNVIVRFTPKVEYGKLIEELSIPIQRLQLKARRLVSIKIISKK